MNEKNVSAIKINHLKTEIAINDLDSKLWQHGDKIAIESYWSGKRAPAGRHFQTRLLWSDTALYVRFEANYDEQLIVSTTPDVTQKTKGLWDRDVCEIFIAPDKNKRNKYYEFQIAPTGEWIDLGIHVTPEKRETDLGYSSGMESAVRIEKATTIMAIKIPWKAFGRKPRSGDVWLGNLFRCVGKDPTRGYLSWQTTKTEVPNFHVPSKFGEFRFTN